jgi:predicted DNA binding CopG/RHH family protein
MQEWAIYRGILKERVAQEGALPQGGHEAVSRRQLMKKLDPLDQEEREILESFEADEWKSVPDKEKEMEKFQADARATFRKDERVSVRLSSKDLEALKKRALVEGIPYQTLIASVLHKYASGQLREE